MKSRVRQMWERFVDAYWAGARRRFEEETLPWMYPPVKPLSPAETPTPPIRLTQSPTHKAKAA
jgi:hypothetical protein